MTGTQMVAAKSESLSLPAHHGRRQLFYLMCIRLEAFWLVEAHCRYDYKRMVRRVLGGVRGVPLAKGRPAWRAEMPLHPEYLSEFVLLTSL